MLLNLAKKLFIGGHIGLATKIKTHKSMYGSHAKTPSFVDTLATIPDPAAISEDFILPSKLFLDFLFIAFAISIVDSILHKLPINAGSSAPRYFAINT